MRLMFVPPALTVLALTAAAVAQSQDRPRVPMPPPGHPGMTAPGAREPSGGSAAPAPNANMSPFRGQASANAADQSFLSGAARCSAAQSELARLAEQKAGSPSVREFARQMISDHDQTSRALRTLTESEGSAASDQDAEFRQARDALSRLSGAEFDIEYLRHEVAAHQRMATLMIYEIGSGNDPQVQRFASGALPKIYAHLAMARQLLDQTSMQNPHVAGALPRKASGMPTPQTPRARDVAGER